MFRSFYDFFFHINNSKICEKISYEDWINWFSEMLTFSLKTIKNIYLASNLLLCIWHPISPFNFAEITYIAWYESVKITQLFHCASNALKYNIIYLLFEYFSMRMCNIWYLLYLTNSFEGGTHHKPQVSIHVHHTFSTINLYVITNHNGD